MPNKPSHKSVNKKAASHNTSPVARTSTPNKSSEFAEEMTVFNNASSNNPYSQSETSKKAKTNKTNDRDEFSRELTNIINRNLTGTTPRKNKNKKK